MTGELLMESAFACPICGGGDFLQRNILWKELVSAWELSETESHLIDRQQGLCCAACGANLRSMTMAAAILREFDSKELFLEFVQNNPAALHLKLIEINTAGTLTPYLSQFRNYTFAQYPEVDLQALPYTDEAFDIVVHGDTLEHIPDAVQALKECNRVIARAGMLFYTIPIVPSKMTRRRAGLVPSYHGSPEQNSSDYMVHTEYGADFFVEPVVAGFNNITLQTLGGLASFCIVCRKF